ncbi:MAG: hypothetical protein GDA36_03020 [Rhodobacteraceae bacterium]|nr:hypothetical protein [Paracoccaceae bacterium]
MGRFWGRTGEIGHAQDVRALSQDQAIDVFIRRYYEHTRLALLRVVMFDTDVNAGGNAARHGVIRFGDGVEQVGGVFRPNAKADVTMVPADTHAQWNRMWFIRRHREDINHLMRPVIILSVLPVIPTIVLRLGFAGPRAVARRLLGAGAHHRQFPKCQDFPKFGHGHRDACLWGDQGGGYRLRSDSPGVADTDWGANLTLARLGLESNPALNNRRESGWRTVPT